MEWDELDEAVSADAEPMSSRRLTKDVGHVDNFPIAFELFCDEMMV